MVSASSSDVWLAPNHVAEAREILQQQRGRGSLSVRQQYLNHFTGEPVISGLVEHRPPTDSAFVSSFGIVLAAVLAVAFWRFIRLEPLLGPLAMIDVRDLHDRSRSLKSLTCTVRNQRAGIPASA